MKYLLKITTLIFFLLHINTNLLLAQNNAIQVDAAGNVGIGTAPSNAKLRVMGDGWFSTNLTAGSITSGTINTNGWTINAGNGTINCGTLNASTLTGTLNGAVDNSSVKTTTMDVSGGFGHFSYNLNGTNPPTTDPGLYVCWNKNTAHAETDFINNSLNPGFDGGFNFYNFNGTNIKQVLTINGNGNVGIGTPTAEVSLDIKSSASNIKIPKFAWFGPDRTSILTVQDGQTSIVSIRTDAAIISPNIYCTSDFRIKKNIVQSDPNKDLNLLKQLKVTDFQYKDYVLHGSKNNKGFIAQEVEQLFPQAVEKRPDFIPDIFTLADKVTVSKNILTVSMKEPHHLLSGNMVRLITEENATEERPVTVIDEKTFSVPNWTYTTDKIFVYGKKVDDFRTINYDQIFSLGISAIQQLSKQMDAAKAENAQLRSDNAATQKAMIDLQKKLLALETKIDQFTKPVAAVIKN